MSERDDGETGDLTASEPARSGESESAPVSRASRGWRLALVVGTAAALITAALARPTELPERWALAILPGAETLFDLYGGASIDIVPRGETPPKPESMALLRERLAPALGLASIEQKGSRVHVRFLALTPEQAEARLSAAVRPGRLEMRQVEAGSELMRRLYARAADDPRAAELGVVGAIDAWEDESTGGRTSDHFLRAHDRNALETYLREMSESDASLRPERGFAVVLEEVDDPGTETVDERNVEEVVPPEAVLRTHLVHSEPVIDSRHLVDAYVYWNPNSNQPEVLLELSREGGERFAEWTGSIVGDKIAILLDGDVISAPVVEKQIEGGRISITMGYGDPRDLQRDAEELAAAFDTRPLPFEVDLRPAEPIPQTVSDGDLLLVRVLLALAVGLALAVPIFLLERRARRIDPAVAPEPGRARRRPWGKLSVTAAGVGVSALSGFVTLPGLAPGTIERLGGPPPGGSMSIVALGLGPILSAFIVVELAALLVPPWRHLRVGGPADRSRLALAVGMLSIVFAVVQSWFIAGWLQSLGSEWLAPGAASFYRTIALLVAGTVGLALVALLVDRFGLGNGFAAVILGGFALQVVPAVDWLRSDDAGAAQAIAMGLGVGLTVILTSAILRWRSPSSTALSGFRMPTAGLVPYGMPTAIIGVVGFWPDVAMGLDAWWGTPLGADLGRLVRDAALLIILSAALSWAFSRPSRLGAVAASMDGPAARRLWWGLGRAALLSTAYLLALLAIERTLGDWAFWAIPVLAAALATAIAMDLVAEWRALARRDDLAPIWMLHQVPRVSPVVEALARNRIDVHTRGLHLRSLLHFFGPFVPILVMVPAARREEAVAILRAQLDGSIRSPSQAR
jgi:SecY